jgi:uncharacterized protein YjbI with pentapeptide repeats
MSDDWPRCGQCGGIRIAGGDSCLAHANPGERAAAFKQFSESGELDVRGVTISDALLREILDAVPHDAGGRRTFSVARFDRATFEGDARFGEATFEGDASFGGATFEGDASFGEATFKGDPRFGGATFKGGARFGEATFEVHAWFNQATFEGGARFDKATFNDGAWFDRATFEGDARFDGTTFEGVGAWFGGTTFEGGASFDGATFKGDARFDGTTFKEGAWFDRATFKGDASFGEATFKGGAWFNQATFEGGARFHRATFKGDAWFGEATFEGEVPTLGPIAVGEQLNLEGVQFASPVRIEADAGAVTCRRGRFPGGVRFDVRHADVRLDDTDLSVPSLLTGPRSPAEIAGRPRMLSLQGANVAGLTLGNVNLALCRFAGAHNLDKLRLEAGTVFGLSPAVAGWEHRQVIAEEVAWRARARPGRWSAPKWPDVEEPEVLSPGAVAVLYRALRKSREDAKDEPGAADFYYGEMDMRRHDRETSGAKRWRGSATRIVLTAYWLVSGYGLRASRSLVTLAMVTALFAAAFHYIGFTLPPEPASYWTSLLYTFRSTISLTDSQVTLTAWGSFFQALLRITGPVLLGLTLLALRNRVKR